MLSIRTRPYFAQLTAKAGSDLCPVSRTGALHTRGVFGQGPGTQTGSRTPRVSRAVLAELPPAAFSSDSSVL